MTGEEMLEVVRGALRACARRGVPPLPDSHGRERHGVRQLPGEGGAGCRRVRLRDEAVGTHGEEVRRCCATESSRFYCDADEVQGLVRLMHEEREARTNAEERAALTGAMTTLEILGAHQLKYPRDFMLVFRSMLFEEYETDKDQED